MYPASDWSVLCSGPSLKSASIRVVPSQHRSFVRAIRAVPSSRPAVAAGRRAQGRSRLAALAATRQGLVLTAPSTVPPSCRLGRRRVRLHAFEPAFLVENRPSNAGKLIGERDRQHIVVQSLFGGPPNVTLCAYARARGKVSARRFLGTFEVPGRCEDAALLAPLNAQLIRDEGHRYWHRTLSPRAQSGRAVCVFPAA